MDASGNPAGTLFRGAGLAIALVATFVACTSEPPRNEGTIGTGGAPSNGGSVGAAGSLGGTGPSGGGTFGGGSGGTVIVVEAGDAPDTPPCEGLECDRTTCTSGPCTQMPCAPGVTTNVSGIVYDPAGKVPLYNVVVYVPNGEVPAFGAGASCDRCGQSILNPVVSAITDTRGAFTLTDVPVGAAVPLVIQIGKWRRQVTVPVTACAENPLADPNLTRLPRNQSEGDIPLIAIATGAADSMECLPRRMGIDDVEFTTEAGAGRIHLYAGPDNPGGLQGSRVSTKVFDPTLGGATMSASNTLWSDTTSLSRYDIVILSCEGATMAGDKPAASRQALYDYASLGGRVFSSHWHHVWFSGGPAPVPDVGAWMDREPAPADPSLGAINTTFPKGQALSEWLVNVGASTVPGELEIREPRDNIQSVNPTYATEWITVQNTNQTSPATVQYMSFNTPLDVAEDQKCGRVVFTDLHVSTASSVGNDTRGEPFPLGCQVRDLTPQEKAVEFMLFDLSSCIMDDDDPPEPPRPPR